MKKCPKCLAEMHEKVIGPKKRSACTKCNYLHYENLGKTGYDIHLEKILAAIVKTGSYEVEYNMLANSTFREHYGGHSTAEQLTAWCEMHELSFNIVEKKDSIGKRVQVIHFRRAAA
ncbi:MAG TPA: hypothetical protein VK737_01120 [Opitutales bacterium]|jgi:hypothetical protein|nr:hypothetical protein [Opitutales bacterium]